MNKKTAGPSGGLKGRGVKKGVLTPAAGGPIGHRRASLSVRLAPAASRLQLPPARGSQADACTRSGDIGLSPAPPSPTDSRHFPVPPCIQRRACHGRSCYVHYSELLGPQSRSTLRLMNLLVPVVTRTDRKEMRRMGRESPVIDNFPSHSCICPNALQMSIAHARSISRLQRSSYEYDQEARPSPASIFCLRSRCVA